MTESDGNSSSKPRERVIVARLGVTRRTALEASVAGLLGWSLSRNSPAASLLQRERPRPGSIELNNGMIFSGQCGPHSTLAPRLLDQAESDRPDQKLLMRYIDQGAREIFVHVKNSKDPVFDNAMWPSLTFTVPRQKKTRKPLPDGMPVVGQFDETGVAKGQIVGGSRVSVDVEVAISSINELFAEVRSQTHHWSYAVPTNSLPQHTLLGVLTQIEGYKHESVRRLELIRMLIRANRLAEAAFLVKSVQTDFPDVAAQNPDFQQSLREPIARQITEALEQRRACGQHNLASKGARLHSREDLTPETVVRINNLSTDYDSIFKRIEVIKSSIMTLTAELKDDIIRTAAGRIGQLVVDQIDPDSVDRFVAFELVMPQQPAADKAKADDAAPQEGPPADELLAMAFSGWLMGADQTVQSLSDVISLFEARQGILDYLSTDANELDARRELADSVRKLEGVGVDRVASMVRLLPPVQPVPLAPETEPGQARGFRVEAIVGRAGCVGLVPAEYHESRRYPTLIAFPPEFGTADEYLSFWQSSCDRYGYIAVVPFWKLDEAPADVDGEDQKSPPASARYDASASRHQDMLALLRHLKRGLQVDDDAVFVAGHSQGGEIAIDMATSHPDLFAGVLPVCPSFRRHFLFTLGNAVQVPWYIVVGDSQAGWFDQFGPLAARLFKRDLDSDLYFDVIFIKHPFRGMLLYPEEREDQFKWMARQRRKPRPATFTTKVLRNSDLSWSWISLDSLPERFAELDAASTGNEQKFTPAELTVRTTDRNLILIKIAPSGITIRLSPDMAGFDLQKPVRIDFGREKMSVDYAPNIGDLLGELYETGDRSRLCYHKVHVDK